MYRIEKKIYGFKLTFGEFINKEEMRNWVEESKKALASVPQNFGVFVDMRTLRPLDQETQAIMQEGQKLYKQKGMERSCVILASAVLTMQFQRIAKESGIYQWERYLDASSNPKWQQQGEDWINKGIDPDKK